jgi:hypothetical protein
MQPPPTEPLDPAPSPTLGRLAACATCIVCVGLLGLAALRPPDRGGPPCAIGIEGPIRCPGCGLTHGLHALLHGHPLEACRHNLLTPLVAATLLAGAYVSGGCLLLRRRVLAMPGALWLLERLWWWVLLGVALWAAMQLLGW